MVIELRKRSVLSVDLVVGLLLTIGLIPLVYLFFAGGWAFYAFLASGGVGLTLVGRKFARAVSFDFGTRTVRTVSVLPLFRQTYSFDDLARVHLVRATGFGGRGGRENLVVRRSSTLQPTVFEVRSAREVARAAELIAALRPVLPEWATRDEPR